MSSPAAIQPSSAHGPGRFLSMSGTVMNTPAPTIMLTLSAVACSNPKCRSSLGWGSEVAIADFKVGGSIQARTAAADPVGDPGDHLGRPHAGVAEQAMTQ